MNNDSKMIRVLIQGFAGILTMVAGSIALGAIQHQSSYHYHLWVGGILLMVLGLGIGLAAVFGKTV